MDRLNGNFLLLVLSHPESYFDNIWCVFVLSVQQTVSVSFPELVSQTLLLFNKLMAPCEKQMKRTFI